jgi:hypothetical protein
MPSDPKAPSAWQIEKSVAAWHSLIEQLAEDGVLGDDEAQVADLLNAQGMVPPTTLLRRAIDACYLFEVRANEADLLRAQLVARRDRYLRRSAATRQTVLSLMEMLNLRDVSGNYRRALLSTSRAGVVITDPDKVPDRFCEIIRTPRKTLIAEAWKDGEVIDGAERANPRTVLVLREV